MALLHVLFKLAGELEIELVAAHFNHCLRPEADQEEAFVRRKVEALGLPLVRGREDVRALKRSWGRSLEETARLARYRFLEEVRENYGLTKIALGHHLLDQAETVLINILRGSGLSGLKGMEPVRDERYIRPLLYISPPEIAAYLAREGIEFCTDRSNWDERFLRNRVRHRLIPLLEREFNPRLVNTLSRMADILRIEDEFLAAVAEAALRDLRLHSTGDDEYISNEGLRKLAPAVRKRVVKGLLESMRPEGKAVCLYHVAEVEKMALSPRPGKRISVPGGEVIMGYEELILRRKRAPLDENFSYTLDVPGEVRVGPTGQLIRTSLCGKKEVPKRVEEKNILYVDVRALRPPITVRNWQPGDRMRPLGLAGTRKVQDILGEMKVPRFKRHLTLIFEDREGILWVGGLKVAERCRLQPDLQQVVKIEII